MAPTRSRIAVPPGFSLPSTIRSHGWCSLPPFTTDRDHSVLRLGFVSREGRAIRCTVRSASGALLIDMLGDRPLIPSERRSASAVVRSCLRLDEDFEGLLRLARRTPRLRWIAARGAGRMLRAPTAFEDAVKMICTTNCTWSLTTAMVGSLVRLYGDPLPGGGNAFPRPEVLAAAGTAALRRDAKLGYRSPFVAAFAAQVAEGSVDPEAWRDWRGDTAGLAASMRQVKGIGPYAAENLLKLAGRYGHLGLDSWVRKRYAELRHGGRRVSDRTIERAYAVFGDWKGLVFWLEMTREWYERKFPAGGAP